MGLVAIGLSHHTAPVDVRASVAFSRDEAIAVLRRLKAERDVPQALLLSTCNRTEVYAFARNEEAALGDLRDVVFGKKLASYNGSGDQLLYRHAGDKAVEHFYRVACGLDSMVLGEQQILGQVRTAYELSLEAAVAGSVLHRLVNGAVRVGKRARTETKIGSGSISVASIAIELAEKVFQNFHGRTALLVGAGENGRVCAQHLLDRDIGNLLIANRTLARAEALAADLGGETVAFDALGEAVARADVVVSTTGAPETVIDAGLVRAAMRKRDQRALVLIDIAVPPDIDPAVDSIQNVFRFDLDALQSAVDHNVARRQHEVPVVEKLVSTEVGNFMRWSASLDAGPVIRDLHRTFESIREFELGRNVKRFHEQDREQIEIFSRNLVRKLLMGITQEIKTYRSDNPLHMERLAALRHMFQLAEAGNTDEGKADEEKADEVV